MASSNKQEVTGWVGWVGFASFLLLFAGFFHIIQGIADLSREAVFLNNGNLWVLDYTQWGWINIVGGILAIIAGLSLGNGKMFGRIFASIVVVGSGLAAVATLPFYPVWSIVVLTVDALILYAIMVHGGELKD